MKTVAIAGTFDSKGKEFLYLKELFEEIGLNTLTLHTGTFESYFVPDVSNEEIAAEAGENLRELVGQKDRARATAAMAKGTEKIVPRLYQEGKFQGIISLGGSGGTSVITPAMRALPIGVPKIVVSTMASGNTEQYVGTSDVILIPRLWMWLDSTPFPPRFSAMRSLPWRVCWSMKLRKLRKNHWLPPLCLGSRHPA